jgi:fatty acid desaturase
VSVRKHLRPGFAIPYGVALAILVVAVVFFGWAGFWLGLAVLVLVKTACWGVPLIKLSYHHGESPASAQAAPAEQVDRAEPSGSAEPADPAQSATPTGSPTSS